MLTMVVSDCGCYLGNSQNTIHYGLSVQPGVIGHVAVQTGQVKGNETCHGEPEEEYVACFPSLIYRNIQSVTRCATFVLVEG